MENIVYISIRSSTLDISPNITKCISRSHVSMTNYVVGVFWCLHTLYLMLLQNTAAIPYQPTFLHFTYFWGTKNWFRYFFFVFIIWTKLHYIIRCNINVYSHSLSDIFKYYRNILIISWQWNPIFEYLGNSYLIYEYLAKINKTNTIKVKCIKEEE